jgi:hypothetical protein
MVKQGILWMGIALCTIAFSLRVYIRIVCFRQPMPEDYLMLTSLVVLIGFAIMAQIYLGDIYYANHVLRGEIMIDLQHIQEVFSRAATALKVQGASLILFVIGIDIIKLNFLVFFYRIGKRIQVYLILWWIAFLIVLGCGFIGIGIIPYHCVFDDVTSIIAHCSNGAYAEYESTVNRASVGIDIMSDLIGVFLLSCLFPRYLQQY